MQMSEDEIGEEDLGEDASIVKQLVYDIDNCARYLEVTAIAARLPGTRWYSCRYLAGNTNIGHLVVVMDAKTGEVVATYAGVTNLGGSG